MCGGHSGLAGVVVWGDDGGDEDGDAKDYDDDDDVNDGDGDDGGK